MPTIRTATAADVPRVIGFLARELAGDGGPARYRRYLEYTWLDDKPNLGFLIEDAGAVVGFVGAIYAVRRIRGVERRFCNIHSLAVADSHRKYSLPMIKRLVDQPGYTFTTFSPSDRAAEIFAFFKFERIDQDKVVFTPAAGWTRARFGTRVHRGAAVRDVLDDDQRRVMDDHRGYRCGHFLIERGGERCYLVTARRGRGVRVFADVLHASNPQLAAECIAHLHAPVGLAHHTLLIGLDRRWIDAPPGGTFVYTKLKPRMIRPHDVALDDVDGLYSEFIPMYG
jgi:hypothetical protein